MVVYQSGGGAATDIKESALSATLKQKLTIAEYFVRGTTLTLAAEELDAGLSVAADVASTQDSYIVMVAMKNSGVPTNSTSLQIKYTSNANVSAPNMDVGTNSVPTVMGFFTFNHGPVADECTGGFSGSRGGTDINGSATTAMGANPMTGSHVLSVFGRSGKADVTMSFSVNIYRMGGTA